MSDFEDMMLMEMGASFDELDGPELGFSIGGKVSGSVGSKVSGAVSGSTSGRVSGSTSGRARGSVSSTTRPSTPTPRPTTTRRVSTGLLSPARSRWTGLARGAAVRAAIAQRAALAAAAARRKKPVKRPSVRLAVRRVKPVIARRTMPRATRTAAFTAMRPYAHACGCPPAMMMSMLDGKLQSRGYMPGAAIQVMAALKNANALLEKAALQRTATAEHLRLKGRNKFRRQVLNRLAKLAECLPKGHPTRTRAKCKCSKG